MANSAQGRDSCGLGGKWRPAQGRDSCGLSQHKTAYSYTSVPQRLEKGSVCGSCSWRSISSSVSMKLVGLGSGVSQKGGCEGSARGVRVVSYKATRGQPEGYEGSARGGPGVRGQPEGRARGASQRGTSNQPEGYEESARRVRRVRGQPEGRVREAHTRRHKAGARSRGRVGSLCEAPKSALRAYTQGLYSVKLGYWTEGRS